MMIVVAVIALLAASVPNFMRARKRTQATQILEDLRVLDQAVELYAVETSKKAGDRFVWNDLKPYIKPGTALV